ncbi:MAG TPA: hypothetical protein VF711_03655, partial [Acidimicrobiales bacterium]
MIGRGDDLAALVDLVSASRLVTISGPGGVGKTRLALEVAGRGDGVARDCTWLVELADVAAPELVAEAVVSQLVPQVGENTGLSQIVEFLGDRVALLVLDNCEHVVEACAALAGGLLRSCRELRILATSQEPLGLPGERVWRLGPLRIPEPGEVDPEVLAANESVQLFVERASEVGTGSPLSANDAPAVAEVCRRLDGLPLAIELAAARCPVLTPAEIAARVDESSEVLSGRPSGPARHLTLRATFEWSYNLLHPEEAALLRRLSVLAGGCSLAAVEELCSGGSVTRDSILDLLAALVAKSLVETDQAQAESRYRILRTVREYARGKLDEAGEAHTWSARHAAWCIGRAEEARQCPGEAGHEEHIARLEADHDEFRTALAWARGAGDFEVALRLANSLTGFWQTRGHLREGVGWLEWASGAQEGPAVMRAEAFRGAGQLRRLLGEERAGLALIEHSVTLFRESGAAEETDGCMCHDVLHVCNSPVDAIPGLEDKVRTVRAHGDANRLAHGLCNLGQARFFRGDAAGARVCFDEALSLRPHIEAEAVDDALWGLARVGLLVGEYDSVEPLLLEVLQR